MGQRVPQAKSDHAIVAVASAEDAKSAVARAAALLGVEPPLGGDTVVLLPPPPATQDLRCAVRALVGGFADIARPSVLADVTSRWAIVVTGPGAWRFDDVWVPARLIGRQRTVVMPLPTKRESATPISLLAAFAEPRQRLVGMFARGIGVAAELAAPLRPDLTAMVGGIGGDAIVVLSRDLVGAELVARAWGPSDDALVPWEHATVQRAIGLDLGVDGPHRLRLIASGAAAAAAVARIAPRLGLDAASGMDEGPG